MRSERLTPLQERELEREAAEAHRRRMGHDRPVEERAGRVRSEPLRGKEETLPSEPVSVSWTVGGVACGQLSRDEVMRVSREEVLRAFQVPERLVPEGAPTRQDAEEADRAEWAPVFDAHREHLERVLAEGPDANVKRSAGAEKDTPRPEDLSPIVEKDRDGNGDYLHIRGPGGCACGHVHPAGWQPPASPELVDDEPVDLEGFVLLRAASRWFLRCRRCGTDLDPVWIAPSLAELVAQARRHHFRDHQSKTPPPADTQACPYGHTAPRGEPCVGPGRDRDPWLQCPRCVSKSMTDWLPPKPETPQHWHGEVMSYGTDAYTHLAHLMVENPDPPALAYHLRDDHGRNPAVGPLSWVRNAEIHAEEHRVALEEYR